MVEYLDGLKKEFNNRINIVKRRENIYQIMAPFFHEDGDMMNIFLTKSEKSGHVRICDLGKTLMRLSYTFDIDTDHKKNVLLSIIAENMGEFDDGNIFIDVEPQYLFNGIMQYSQLLAKVSNLNIMSKETVSNLFYDYLSDYVMTELQKYRPEKNYHPLRDYPDLSADFCIKTKNKPLFLFGIRDDSRASKVIIACLQFQRNDIDFRSVIVFDLLDKISKFNKVQVMDICDKQFSSLDSFKSNAPAFVEKELR